MDVSLVIFKADGTRRDFPVAKPRTLLGRARACDLRIPVASVSRKHCEIRVNDDGEISVEDLASSNGTLLNRHRIEKATMHAGDELMIGPVVFTLLVNGQPNQIMPVPSLIDKPDASSAHDEQGLDLALGQEGLDSADGEEAPPDFADTPPKAPAETTPSLQLTSLGDANDELDDPIGALDALANEEDDDIDELLTSRKDDDRPGDQGER